MHLYQIPKFAQLDPEILVELIKVPLQPLFPYLGRIRSMARVGIYIRYEDRLRELRFDVFSRTSVSVTTGSDLEVEGTVNSVLFCAAVRKGGCQLLSYGGTWWGRAEILFLLDTLFRRGRKGYNDQVKERRTHKMFAR